MNCYLFNLPPSGSIPEEIAYLDQLAFLHVSNNRLSGPVASKLFNISTLVSLHVTNNSLSGTLPSNLGSGCPNLRSLKIRGNKFEGNIPNGIANASKLTEIDFLGNQFSGTIPDVFGGLTYLECLHLDYNKNLKLDDSFGFNFLTSLTGCTSLKYLSISRTRLSKLPKSIGSLTVGYFWAYSCGIDGNLPPEIGNMRNLVQLSMSRNNLNGLIPRTIKELHYLQYLDLEYNGLQGSIVDELVKLRV
ncbi:putative LRR receptor serine/threonine-protein kinase [Trifolium repens]|jgi:LRR receptor-like serine/threonine-protein kinase FLS2|nr:putative LRR receptor serine/threonine-protein kinase [Trifolium repens]